MENRRIGIMADGGSDHLGDVFEKPGERGVFVIFSVLTFQRLEFPPWAMARRGIRSPCGCARFVRLGCIKNPAALSGAGFGSDSGIN